MAKKKSPPASSQPPARAGASASQQAPAPGRGINAAPPGARLVAEAVGLPCFWWRLRGIWEFVCGFFSRGIFRVVGDGESAATHADAAGGLGASSSAGLGARSSAASASDAAPLRGSLAAPKPAGPDVLGSSSSASQDKANAGSAASSSKIATSGSDQSTTFPSDAEEAADSAQFLEAPGRITIRSSLMYTAGAAATTATTTTTSCSPSSSPAGCGWNRSSKGAGNSVQRVLQDKQKLSRLLFTAQKSTEGHVPSVKIPSAKFGSRMSKAVMLVCICSFAMSLSEGD
ncbi:hypothetical protein EJB05_08946, partial [Eragrostis curvula]